MHGSLHVLDGVSGGLLLPTFTFHSPNTACEAEQGLVYINQANSDGHSAGLMLGLKL